MDRTLTTHYREHGMSAYFARWSDVDLEHDGTETCMGCGKDLVLMWLEFDHFRCDDCECELSKDQLYFSCDECDYDTCHACAWHELEWSVRGDAPARGLAQQRRREQEELERCEREQCDREQWEREQHTPIS